MNILYHKKCSAWMRSSRKRNMSFGYCAREEFASKLVVLLYILKKVLTQSVFGCIYTLYTLESLNLERYTYEYYY